MDSLTPKPSVVDEIAAQAEPHLVLITRPPDDSKMREEIGNKLWNEIVQRFVANLSERDKQLWDNPPSDVSKSPEHLQLLRAFDLFLLPQFGQYGVPLLWALGALQRIAEWVKHEPPFLERMGKELALKSRILRSEKSAPIPDDIDIFADDAIEELGRLLRRQRDEFASRPGVTSCRRVAGWVKAEIEAHSEEFRRLRVELPQLCGWIETLPNRNPEAADGIVRGEMSGSDLFYLWYANCSNRSVKDVRNLVSRRRAQRRRKQL